MLAGSGGQVFLDVDDTVKAVYGASKQGAQHGYTRIRGLNAQLATLSTAQAAPVIAAAGIMFGGLMLVLSLSGTVDRISKLFTPPVVRGIQLGLGLIFLRKGIDLIVTGSHGHGGLSTVIGSTSGSVLHQASCDILVVRVD